MKTLDICFKDLSKEKQKEIKKIIAVPIKDDDYIFSIQIYTKEDLDVDSEQAMVERRLNNPTIH